LWSKKEIFGFSPSRLRPYGSIDPWGVFDPLSRE